MFSVNTASPTVPSSRGHTNFPLHPTRHTRHIRIRSANAPGGWTGRTSTALPTDEDADRHQDAPENANHVKVMTALQLAEEERRHNEDSEDIDQLRKILDSNNRSYLKGLLRDRHYPAQRSAVREYLWKRMLKVLAGNREADIYQEMKRQLYPEGPHEGIAGSLPPFVDLNHVTTLPYATRLQLSNATCLLHMLAESRPDITYAPLLLPLMLLFHKILPEEDAFDLLYALVIDRHHARLPQTLTACRVQTCVLERFVSKYLKPFYSTLVEEIKKSSDHVTGPPGLPLHHVLMDWYWWIFEYLPVDYVLVISDSYLAEGIKFLFRAAVALVAHYSRANGRNRDALRNFPTTMREFCKSFDSDIDRFYKTMLSFRAFSSARMEKYFRKYERIVQSSEFAAEVGRVSAGPASEPDGHQSQASKTAFLQLIPPANSMLNRDLLMCIYNWLPARIQLCKPLLVFTTAVDGTSLGTFYTRCDRFEPLLIIIKTVGTPNKLFGAYCSTALANRTAQPGSYFGTGESFLFRLAWGGVSAIKYAWVGENKTESVSQTSHMFIMGADRQLHVGGGAGTGLCLQDPLTSGFSERCSTFNNAPLAGDLRDFECHTVEAYAFQP